MNFPILIRRNEMSKLTIRMFVKLNLDDQLCQRRLNDLHTPQHHLYVGKMFT